jgi:hypothetical protein
MSKHGKITKNGNAHSKAQEQSQKTPSTQASLRFLVAALSFFAYCLRQFGRGIRQSPRLILRSLGNERMWTWFFRVLTLVSVSYLVSDRIYEMDATISSPASDPKNAFLFPFSIQNNSHIFRIKNIQWACTYGIVKGPRINFSNNLETDNGRRVKFSQAEI